jgi:ubiquitin carboxyl-terminal hydrolase 34
MQENFPGFAPHIQSERQALRSDVGYAGLRNLSNTCYLNSLFSQLFMNLKFREFIFAIDPTRTGSSGQPLVRELSRLFASMQNRWDKYVDTSDVVACVETYDNEQIDVSIQMDVDEFFNLLFDRLEGQISDPDEKDTFRSLYGGQLVQQIKSCECDHISERLEPFSAIQCEIKGKLTLEDSLRAYVEGEVMQGG